MGSSALKRAAWIAAALLFAPLAPALAQDNETLIWARASSCPLIRDYIARYPSGRYVGTARAALQTRNCPDPEADARRAAVEKERFQHEAAVAADARARAEQESRDLRDRLARAETRAAEEARKRQAAETQQATKSSATTTFDLTQLHPDVRRAVESARAAQIRAIAVAARARFAAAEGENRGTQSNVVAGIGKTISSGDVYSGNFANSMYNGVGVYKWSVPTTATEHFEGDWVDNRKRGVGIAYYRSGDRYAGDFIDDKKDGYGVYTYADGTRYEGAFSASEYAGYGVEWNLDGTVGKAGIWTNNALSTPLRR